MLRTILGSTVLATSLAALALWAGSPVAVAQADSFAPGPEVEGGQFRLLRLGVPEGGKLGDLLRKNAKISAGFEVIGRKKMPGALVKASNFDKAGWDALGADTVILADTSGPQIKLRLFEVAKGQKPVLSRGYPGGDPLAAANKFMNEVIKYYTGEAGVFGSRIAFVRTRRNPITTKNVVSVQMNGEAAQAVTNNRSLNILPSIGPGGEVLFTSYAKRNPDLWMGGAGGSKRISKQPGLNLGGVMSPDGGSIALALSKDGNSEIYTVDRGGNIKARLTKSPAIDGSPTWSNSGQIAFVSNRAGGPQIFRMSAGGGGAAKVSKKGSYNQSPDWNQGSKDRGQWIVYSGRDSSNRYALYKVNAKSGKTVTLSANPGRNLDPSWSPDGRLIAYSRDGGIFVANENGDNNVQIAKGGSTPDWGPRGD